METKFCFLFICCILLEKQSIKGVFSLKKIDQQQQQQQQQILR